VLDGKRRSKVLNNARNQFSSFPSLLHTTISSSLFLPLPPPGACFMLPCLSSLSLLAFYRVNVIGQAQQHPTVTPIEPLGGAHTPNAYHHRPSLLPLPCSASGGSRAR